MDDPFHHTLKITPPMLAASLFWFNQSKAQYDTKPPPMIKPVAAEHYTLECAKAAARVPASHILGPGKAKSFP
jgi:hypothetical protein